MNPKSSHLCPINYLCIVPFSVPVLISHWHSISRSLLNIQLPFCPDQFLLTILILQYCSFNQCVSSLYLPLHLGYLRGVEVIDHITFTYTDRAQSFYWRRFGFKMHLPDHALPPGVNECQIRIQASLSGQFQFPEDTEILSCVYWVTCPHKFAKPVTVEIQHCAKPEHLQHPSNLIFIVAKCNQYLPYQFKILDGGVFSPHSRYGSIELTHFSGLGIAFHSVMQWLGLSSYQPQLDPKNYCARLYYSRSGIHCWEVYFAIMWDLEVYIAVSITNAN